ncbi:MAG: threonylcarbamoyl-AMP synthase [Proteobacteria bacterium]|nr:threonylcarbamoyl-AMP synthase [Pseudomonadota bacterium]
MRNIRSVEVAQPSQDAILRAAEHLRAGRLVAFPTETVYGIGADATNGRAVAAIYEAKGRPTFNPLIATVGDLAAAEAIAELGPLARRLAAVFWPGPLTMVLRAKPESAISSLVTAGLDTVAVRMPSHPIALTLMRAVGLPVAAPSANRSGHVSATTAEHVASDLGEKVAMILDGGPATVGVESTILDVSDDRPVLLRPGALTLEDLTRVIGETPQRPSSANAAAPNSPGQLESHYAPGAKVRLGVTAPDAGEALLAFGVAPRHDGPCLNLSPSGDLAEAAANLFAALRDLDPGPGGRIAVMPIPERGLGAAINDRLRRAAAPR